MSSRADLSRSWIGATARAAASVASGLFGQVLVLGCDRVPILPPTEATPARSPFVPVELVESRAALGGLTARWRLVVDRRPTADRHDIAAVDARVATLEARRPARASREPCGRASPPTGFARREP